MIVADRNGSQVKSSTLDHTKIRTRSLKFFSPFIAGVLNIRKKEKENQLRFFGNWSIQSHCAQRCRSRFHFVKKKSPATTSTSPLSAALRATALPSTISHFLHSGWGLFFLIQLLPSGLLLAINTQGILSYFIQLFLTSWSCGCREDVVLVCPNGSRCNGQASLWSS